MSFFNKLKEGLVKTKKGFVEKVDYLIYGQEKIDEDFYEELLSILIQADIGMKVSSRIRETLKKEIDEKKIDDRIKIRNLFKERLLNIIQENSSNLFLQEDKLAVYLIVGVNGTGKTTTIGKLAYKFKNEGKKVLLAAGDTFRAAAIEQLEIWAKRANVEVIKQKTGADPAAVAYDALQSAKAKKLDILIIDTAGRLQTKVNLMEELRKIKRVINKDYPSAPQEVLLVLDASVGQNAISQAKLFTEAVGVTGIIICKLDGTAKGGIVLAIKEELGIPIKLIGIGEKIEDLQPFEPKEFIEALLS